ncbi:hypothetical protein NQ317_005992 [Molorchus minor]|uniref:Uncharacterized protein n=1 Tax=Molorchus minor TaxID=1323400 RepID=A0ABQ9J7P1_9CUCU|nr:hypothetical protein NQ317_005992 [Molorchus minor]
MDVVENKTKFKGQDNASHTHLLAGSMYIAFSPFMSMRYKPWAGNSPAVFEAKFWGDGELETLSVDGSDLWFDIDRVL